MATTQETGDKELPHAKSARRQLFVRNLPTNAVTEDLVEHFSQSFPIKHALAVLDPGSKECRGYGFVTFADAEDAQRAEAEFNGSELLGKKLKLEVAEPRQRNEADGEAAPKATNGRPKKEIQPSPKLIIRNLPWSINSPQLLTKLFLSYGKVIEAIVPKTTEGKMRGFGIVLLRGRKNAEKAIEGVNGKEVDGRTLAVDWAVDKETWRTTKDSIVEDDVPMADDDGDNDEVVSSGDPMDQDDEIDADDIEPGDELALDEGDDEVGSSDEKSPVEPSRPDFTDCTLFVRNLPFTCEDEDMEEHFSQFGPVRYARVVMEASTGRSRGTGFVCFRTKADAELCLQEAPVRKPPAPQAKNKKGDEKIQQSILEDEFLDESGRYTLDGRVLQISQAVNKSEATRLTEENTVRRNIRDNDKRRLYLLAEGGIPSNSPIYQTLSQSEIAMRVASVKQRKTLVESNPSLHLSLTRLAIRNVPRKVSSKDLKALAREAVVGFASDVKNGLRQPLSKEEIYRSSKHMKEAEKGRKLKGVGLVKQAKIVFEGREGQKVDESTGAGRSRGYGFIEYYTHRNALMGLRWLNGHSIGYEVQIEQSSKQVSTEDREERKKRLIVEFALENAQVVKRRNEKEDKQNSGPKVKKASNAREAGESKDKAGSDTKASFAIRRKSQKLAKLQERRRKKTERRQSSAADKGKKVP